MRARAAGFTLVPVIIAMTIIGCVAFALNRANALSANTVAGRADAERARYAAEAGLQAVNYVVQQKSCLGGFPTTAAPVADTAFGGAAYSAYASAASGSPLTLTSTGTYNGASVTLTRNNVYVQQTGIRQFVHAPRRILGADTYVEAVAPWANYGDRSRIEVGGSGHESLIRFDLSFFPPGSKVVSAYDSTTGALAPGAKLELYRNSPDTSIAAGSFIDAHMINRTAWEEDRATLNTYDGVNAWPTPRYDARQIARAAAERNPGWQGIDVTDAANAWMGPAYINSGLWLRSSPAGTALPLLKLASSDDEDETWRRPRLTLNYLLPCGATAPVAPEGVMVTLTPVADAYISSASPTNNFGASSVLTAYAGASESRRTLLRFSLGSIPSGQRIVSAHLRLASTSMTNTTTSTKNIAAHALNESWVEGTSGSSGATWSTRDGVVAWAPLMMRQLATAMATEDSTGISPPPGTFSTGWLSWNVKGLVQEWIDGLTPNHGLVLVSSVKDDPTLVSREGNWSQRPQLVITY